MKLRFAVTHGAGKDLGNLLMFVTVNIVQQKYEAVAGRQFIQCVLQQKAIDAATQIEVVTTKRNSGNGLGLWVSSGIVKKHDGAMRMRSSTKAHRHGTLFQVRLPSHRKAPSKLSVA